MQGTIRCTGGGGGVLASGASELLHLDAQAGPSATKHLDVLAYNILLHRTYRVPVHSSVLLHRQQAEHPNMNGSICYAARPARGRMEFEFDIIRLLAERLEREATGDQADRLLTAAYILTGLRLKAPDDVRQLFRGVSIAMRESVTYRAILEEGREEGRVEERHRMSLRLGRVRFGEADEAVRHQIEAIRDIVVLEDLSERPVVVSNWAELLA
jgi:hypothetical protein